MSEHSPFHLMKAHLVGKQFDRRTLGAMAYIHDTFLATFAMSTSKEDYEKLTSDSNSMFALRGACIVVACARDEDTMGVIDSVQQVADSLFGEDQSAAKSEVWEAANANLSAGLFLMDAPEDIVDGNILLPWKPDHSDVPSYEASLIEGISLLKDKGAE